MLFFIFRLILGIVIVLPFYCFKTYKNTKVNLRNYIILALVIASLLSLVPFENVFSSFDSPEQAYRYFNTTIPDVKYVVEGTDSDLVIGDKDGADSPLIIPKTDKGWKVGVGINSIPIVDKVVNNCLVNVYHSIGTNDYYLVVYNLSSGALEIADSINSEFMAVEEYSSTDGKRYLTYYAVLPNKDKQYKLYIKGEEYFIF